MKNTPDIVKHILSYTDWQPCYNLPIRIRYEMLNRFERIIATLDNYEFHAKNGTIEKIRHYMEIVAI